MAVWIDAIKNDGQMWQAFAYNVERAPDCAEDELNVGVPFAGVVQADGDRGLANHNGSHVVEDAHGRDLDTVEKFEDICRDENLGANNQDIAHSDQ